MWPACMFLVSDFLAVWLAAGHWLRQGLTEISNMEYKQKQDSSSSGCLSRPQQTSGVAWKN